jgi:hypothetical protein
MRRPRWPDRRARLLDDERRSYSVLRLDPDAAGQAANELATDVEAGAADAVREVRAGRELPVDRYGAFLGIVEREELQLRRWPYLLAARDQAGRGIGRRRLRIMAPPLRGSAWDIWLIRLTNWSSSEIKD